MVLDLKNESLENDSSLNYGKFLAHPPPGEEICISGMSGKFPLAANIEELNDAIRNKTNLISRVPQIFPEMPPGVGKLKDEDLEQFDCGFFGIHRLHAQTMNQITKLLLESCLESIFDAGLHPADLEGTRTGVFMGLCFTESEFYWYPMTLKNGNPITGFGNLTMCHLTKIFKKHAGYRVIHVDGLLKEYGESFILPFQILVPISNMKSMIVDRIGYFLKLKGYAYNSDSACSSSFFALEQGYQAIRNGDVDQALVCGANLILAEGTNLDLARLGVLARDGILRPFDEEGIGYIRSEAATSILLQKSKDCKRIYAKIVHVKTNCDGYKEEGITFPSGEAQLNLLKEVYFESGINPKDVGYIETHGTGTFVGDTEELNGVDDFFTKDMSKPLLVGSVKSNIGHTEAVSGLCSVVKAILAFENDAIAPTINFKTPRSTIPGLREERVKVVVENTPFPNNYGLIGINNFGFGGANGHVILKWNPKNKIGNGEPLDLLPRLVCVSGRTEEAVNCLLDDVSKKFDADHMALIYNSFRKPIKNHLYRGFIIVSTEGVHKKSVRAFDPNKTDLHICFGELFLDSTRMAEDLLNLPILANFKTRIEEILLTKNRRLEDILFKLVDSKQTNLFIHLLVQLCFAELITQLDIEFKRVSFYSTGIFACAYFEKVICLEDILKCMLDISKFSADIQENNNYHNDIFKINSKIEYIEKSNNKSHTIISKKVEHLITSSLLFADCKGIKANGKTQKYYGEAFLQKSQTVFNYKSSVVLDVGQSVATPNNAKKSRVVSFNDVHGIKEVLKVLGKLYEYGVNLQIQNIYPKSKFPVSRGTPMISSKIKWKHDYKYFLPTFDFQKSFTDAMEFKIHPKNEMYAKLVGHNIDGKNVFSSTGHLYLVWLLFGEVQGIDHHQLQVVFENCKFFKVCELPDKDSSDTLSLYVMLQKASGKFGITEGNIIVATGQIRLDNDPFGIQSNSYIANLSGDMINTKDIYMELKLRGYNYSGEYKSITKSNTAGNHGKLRWTGNWIAFMENMLQLKSLSDDTRLPCVPKSIDKLTLNPCGHLGLIENLKGDDNKKIVDILVVYCPDTRTIKSGGIEITGLLVSSIQRKKLKSQPVLEKYQFVPNNARLSLKESIRVLMQMTLENNCRFKLKFVELVDEATEKNAEYLGPIIKEVLEREIYVSPDITILSNKDIKLAAKMESKKISQTINNTIVAGSKLLSRKEILQEAIQSTLDTGFIISREDLNTDINLESMCNLTLINIMENDTEKLIFLRKKPIKDGGKVREYINVGTTNGFNWLDSLKTAVSKELDVVVWCQNEPTNGILGLANCIRKEPNCQDIKCLFIADEAPDFDPSIPFYKQQLDKNLRVNVYRDGQWGTYRHLSLDDFAKVNDQSYSKCTVTGDLSTIKWIEGPLTKSHITANRSLVKVYYSSLSFRDIMIASGKLNVDGVTCDRRKQDCTQGCEFSGKTKDGHRVMGIVSQGALSTLVQADNNLLWKVPENWSLEQAATVPVVYATCLYALVMVGRIKPSDTVLIHSGTGGIGQAAIHLCLNLGCTIFTTVGNEAKRRFILNNYPQISEEHIGNSRDLSFEQLIMKRTNGRGVDIVLNSLAEEHLVASTRCLASNGRFLEIGKYDMSNNNPLDLLAFNHGASYHGVMLDRLVSGSLDVKKELNRMVQEYIDSGVIKPLMTNIFESNNVEKAFRFMAAGKHIGKVLIKIRSEGNESGSQQILQPKGELRYYCDPNKSYVVCGGLGGFGMELVDWLVLRGARNLILTSRKGISSGYQKYRISIWKKYDCKINIFTKDITLKSNCKDLITEANKMAPVDAIFNLAVVLHDAILQNQTAEAFDYSFGPKAYATDYMDEISRILCPNLRNFVVFSSVTCGRGNAGQTNYGMSNSVVERICEKRKKAGYPALTIEWGAIGDVGLVAEKQKEETVEVEIGGTVQQKIRSCLHVMDDLLCQRDAAVVSSMMVAEKRSELTSNNIEEVIASVLGIRDLKSISRNSSLAELGMDSITSSEVKQTLEREFNLFVSLPELRALTLIRIKELHEEACTKEKSLINT